MKLIPMLTAALALTAGGPLHAQSNPADFSLPTPTPTSTPAPQGPLDERAGVPIAPRIITPERSAPVTTPSPQPSPSVRQLPPEPAPAASPAVQATAPPQSAPQAASQNAPASQPGSGQTTSPPTIGDQGGEAADAGAPDVSDPDFESSGESDIRSDGQGPGDRLIGEDEWVDVAPSPSIDLGPSRGFNDIPTPAYVPPEPTNWGLWAALVLALIALALVIRLAWRGRKEPVLQIESDLAIRARQELSDKYKRAAAEQKTAAKARAPQPEPVLPESHPAAAKPATPPPAETAPTPPPSPVPAPASEPQSTIAPQIMPRLSLSLEIGSATRSVMMFTLEYRLTVANRTDTAVRDIVVSARLASAQRGASNAAPLAGGQPIGTIDRIGPQQSRSITAVMQLPMVEVRALRQGSTPVFIPLLHVVLGGIGQTPVTTSFVIGTPSAANHLRLHPITLDTPPGSIAGLRANELRQPISEPVSAKPG